MNSSKFIFIPKNEYLALWCHTDFREIITVYGFTSNDAQRPLSLYIFSMVLSSDQFVLFHFMDL